MRTGQVFGRQPRVGVVLRLADQPDMEIEFVVDTGFDGFLALPPAAVAALHLPFVYNLNAVLASGTSEETPVHQANILWEGGEQAVQVLAMGKRPLLGTMLLDGCDLDIRFVDGAPVSIECQDFSPTS